MKIKTNTPLRELNGDIIMVTENKTEVVNGQQVNTVVPTDEPVTLGRVLSNQLYYGKTDNQYMAFMLSQMFATKEEVDLKSEQVTFLKKFLQTAQLNAGIAGQIAAILEGETVEFPEKK